MKNRKRSREDIEVLEKILGKIERKETMSPDWLASTGVFPDWNTGYTLIQAVSGNLSAAESMQNLMAPSAQVKIMIPGPVEVLDNSGTPYEGEGDRTSRSWMIALFKVLIANG